MITLGTYLLWALMGFAVGALAGGIVPLLVLLLWRDRMGEGQNFGHVLWIILMSVATLVFAAAGGIVGAAAAVGYLWHGPAGAAAFGTLAILVLALAWWLWQHIRWRRSRSLAADAEKPAWRDHEGITPLMRAAEAGDAARVSRLLAQGADLDEADNSGCTALAWAIRRDWLVPKHDVITLLLDKGATLQGGVGPALLVWAARNGDAEVTRRLLRAGIPPDAPNYTQRPALFYAVYRGHAEIVALLLDHGADPTISTTGKTLIEWARTQGHTAIADRLDSAGRRF